MKALSVMMVVAAGFFALAAAAPFTPGVFFPVISLPWAAFVAWRGAVAPGAWIVVFAIVGLMMSPITLAVLISLWGLSGWMAVFTALYAVGALRAVARARA